MRVLIIGAGLAGCAAAAILKERHRVTVLESRSCHGGLCADDTGVQWYGPHAFHTDDNDVMDFLRHWADWRDHALQVHVQMDAPSLARLPRRPGDDPAFRVYSEKAWGQPWEALPPYIRERVPVLCADARPGYHAGRYLCQPAGGYSAMMTRMLTKCRVVYDTPAKWPRSAFAYPYDAAVFTGNINDYGNHDPLPWIYRQWTHLATLGLPDGVQAINYASHNIPALRAYASHRVNPHYAASRKISLEFTAEPLCGLPCYPHPAPQYTAAASRIVADARAHGHILCGRLATYRYMDMDQTVRQVMDAIQEAGL